MKLPADKKERAKVLIAILMGAVLVVYGLAVGVVKPLHTDKKAFIAKTVAIQDKLTRANIAVKRIDGERVLCGKTLSQLDSAVSEKGMVLRPRLGNFLLGAAEIIETHARSANISGQTVTENGISQIPQAKGRAAAAFNIYSVTVRLEAGVHDLLSMLQALECGNPYLCISSLTITGQAAKPGQHAIAFDVQWPIWVDPGMPQKLQDQMKDLAVPTAAPAPAGAGSTENPSK
jgi:hypothetical protein